MEPETYENMLKNPNSLTSVHEQVHDRTSQINNYKIEISTFDKEVLQVKSLASISCIQHNTKEEGMPQAKITPQKEKIKQLSGKYILCWGNSVPY